MGLASCCVRGTEVTGPLVLSSSRPAWAGHAASQQSSEKCSRPLKGPGPCCHTVASTTFYRSMRGARPPHLVLSKTPPDPVSQVPAGAQIALIVSDAQISPTCHADSYPNPLLSWKMPRLPLGWKREEMERPCLMFSSHHREPRVRKAGTLLSLNLPSKSRCDCFG